MTTDVLPFQTNTGSSFWPGFGFGGFGAFGGPGFGTDFAIRGLSEKDAVFTTQLGNVRDVAAVAIGTTRDIGGLAVQQAVSTGDLKNQTATLIGDVRQEVAAGFTAVQLLLTQQNAAMALQAAANNQKTLETMFAMQNQSLRDEVLVARIRCAPPVCPPPAAPLPPPCPCPHPHAPR